MTEKKELLTTVIIPTFNRLTYVQQCLKSIKQTILCENLNYEVIVIDAASNDGTVDFLKNFDEPWLRWISEQDSGAAEAINKGIAMAKGELIRYFSDDDQMVPGDNKRVVQYFQDHPEIDVVSGVARYHILDSDGKTTPIGIVQLVGDITIEKIKQISGCITHETTTFRKLIFSELGDYDTAVRHSFDVELWFRILTARKKFIGFDYILADRFVQPTSNSQINDEQIFTEFVYIFKKYHAWILLIKYIWRVKILKKLRMLMSF